MFNQARLSTLPIAATDIAERWNYLYNFLVGCSVFFTVLILGAMLYFAFSYKRRPGLRTKYITGSHLLEALWTAVPLLLLLGVFVWGFVVYNDMNRPPADAMEIRVVAKQWLWNFQYEDGRILTNKIYVPVNKPVRLVMTSEDVLHSLFVPNFRTKSDIVPGMYTSIWFEPKVTGRHQIFCTEYCGTSHSLMLGDLIVLSESDYEAWKKGAEIKNVPEAGQNLAAAAAPAAADQVHLTAAAPQRSLIEQGHQLAQAKACLSCHSPDGTQKIGPTYKGLYGAKRELDNGKIVLADDNYIRESIENPAAKVVRGYQPGAMPTYKGQLSETELNALIAYVRSLK